MSKSNVVMASNAFVEGLADLLYTFGVDGLERAQAWMRKGVWANKTWITELLAVGWDVELVTTTLIHRDPTQHEKPMVAHGNAWMINGLARVTTEKGIEDALHRAYALMLKKHGEPDLMKCGERKFVDYVKDSNTRSPYLCALPAGHTGEHWTEYWSYAVSDFGRPKEAGIKLATPSEMPTTFAAAINQREVSAK